MPFKNHTISMVILAGVLTTNCLRTA
jgi:hypothetical protein